MWGNDIILALPQAGFLLFFLIPLLIGQWLLWRHRQQQVQAYNSSPLLPQLLMPRSQQLYIAKTIGWSVIWLLICLALMGPFGNLRYPFLPSQKAPAIVPRYPPHEVLFLVDTSASMGVLDGSQGGSRLAEAKQIIEDIVSQLQGQTVSLYAFTSQLIPVVPATSDYLFMRLATRSLQLNEGEVGGTQFLDVFNTLNQKVFNKPSPKLYSLIILSDGGDTSFEQATKQTQSALQQKILSAFPPSDQFSIQLFTIGMGKLTPQVIPRVKFNSQPVKSALNPLLLKALAEQEKGGYYQASEWTPWSLAVEIIEKIGQDPVVTQTPFAAQERQVKLAQKGDLLSDLYFQIPLGVALLFYLFNLLLPDVERQK